jgi:hypothetical protein
MADAQPPSEKTSDRSIRQSHPRAATLAAFGLLAIAAGTVVWLYKRLTHDEPEFFDTDEAPIRVRNGSIDLYLESNTQRWDPVGNSGNWKTTATGEVKGGAYDVLFTVNGGSCSDGQQVTADNVLFTYSDGKRIRVQVVQNRTLVKPENGATLEVYPKDERRLTYSADDGYITEVAVGPPGHPTLICTFQNAAQLNNVRLAGISK